VRITLEKLRENYERYCGDFDTQDGQDEPMSFATWIVWFIQTFEPVIV